MEAAEGVEAVRDDDRLVLAAVAGALITCNSVLLEHMGADEQDEVADKHNRVVERFEYVLRELNGATLLDVAEMLIDRLEQGRYNGDIQ